MFFTEIIKENKEFQTLYRRGSSVVGRGCVVYWKITGRSYNRFGVTSSKKVGNAVERNRARRIIRAAYREMEDKFPIGVDMVLVARGAAPSMKSYHIKKFFRDAVIPAMNQEEPARPSKDGKNRTPAGKRPKTARNGGNSGNSGKKQEGAPPKAGPKTL